MIRVKTATKRSRAKKDRVARFLRFKKNVRAKMGRAFLSSFQPRGWIALPTRSYLLWLPFGIGIAVVHGGRKDARESQMEAVKISGDEGDFCWSRCRRYALCVRGFAPFFFFLSSFYYGIVSRFVAGTHLSRYICKALRYNSLFEMDILYMFLHSSSPIPHK